MKATGSLQRSGFRRIGLPLFLFLLMLFMVGASGTGFSQPLPELEEVTLRDDQGQFWVTIWSDAPVADYHLSYACSPPQLLIDLPGEWKKPSRTRYPQKHDTVKSIAVRHSKEKIQVSLYLKTRKNLTPYIDIAPEGLVLKLKKRHLFDLRDQESSCAVAGTKGTAGSKKSAAENPKPDSRREDERKPSLEEKEEKTDQEGSDQSAQDGKEPDVSQLEPPADKGKKRPFRAIAPEQTDDGLKLLIDLDGPIEEPNIFTLMDQKPPKLVLDFPGIWDNPGPTVLKVDDELIEKIRVGVHDEFLRIVLDLGFLTPPVYEIESAPQGIVLVLKEPES